MCILIIYKLRLLVSKKSIGYKTKLTHPIITNSCNLIFSFNVGVVKCQVMYLKLKFY